MSERSSRDQMKGNTRSRSDEDGEGEGGRGSNASNATRRAEEMVEDKLVTVA